MEVPLDWIILISKIFHKILRDLRSTSKCQPVSKQYFEIWIDFYALTWPQKDIFKLDPFQYENLRMYICTYLENILRFVKMCSFKNLITLFWLYITSRKGFKKPTFNWNYNACLIKVAFFLQNLCDTYFEKPILLKVD